MNDIDDYSTEELNRIFNWLYSNDFEVEYEDYIYFEKISIKVRYKDEVIQHLLIENDSNENSVTSILAYCKFYIREIKLNQLGL